MTKNKAKGTDKPFTPESFQMDKERLLNFLQSQNFGGIEEINEFLRNNVNGKRIDEVLPLKVADLTDAEKSDDLMYEAYESSPAKGKKLAKEALKLHPENIRALNYLAEYEKKPQNALKFYQQAVNIGKKQLGEQFFIKNMGYFWGLIETRPFMTAKLGFANCLNALDWTEEAIHEFSELLELNPNDNQGVRYNLASLFLFTGKYKAYYNLYKKYKDEASAFWLFNYALYLFATEGPTAKANKALNLANQENTHVIDFMTQQKEMTKNPNGYYSPGDENEAAYYLMDNFKLWMNIENTLDWLFRFVEMKRG